MNIICIDFSVTSKDDLKLICKKYQLIYDEMIQKQKTFDLFKVFIDLDAFKLFAYIQNTDKSKIEFTDAVSSILNSIEPCKVEITSSLEEDLTVDKILDKISKYGMGSLGKKEKDFLDEASKY